MPGVVVVVFVLTLNSFQLLIPINLVKSLGTDGINQCGSVRNNAGACYSAGVVTWRIPAR